MAYRFDTRAQVSDEVRRVALGEVDAALASLATKSPPDVERVHDARKHIKKLRSLLRMARAGLGDQAYRLDNDDARQASLAIAGVRDADVMAAALLAIPVPRDGPAVDQQQRAVRELRADAEEIRGRPSTVTGVNRACLRLQGIRQRIESRQEASFGWPGLEPGVRRQYARGRRSMRHADEVADDAAWHRWRKRVKDLWYQLRLLGDLESPEVASLTGAANRLSDLLGDDHDLAVLTGVLRERFHAAAELMVPVAARRAELQAEALILGAHVYAVKPSNWSARVAGWWGTG